VGNAAILHQNELQDLISTNEESLRLLRLGLTRQCALPEDAAMTNIPGMMNELASFKRLAQLLAAEGRSQEMNNRFGDAAASYVDTIHFGNELSRGGFLINRLVGLACEAIGETSLSKLVSKLRPEDGRRVVAELEKIDFAGVTWNEVMQNEARFVRYQQGFNPITWVASRLEVWRSRKRAEVREQRVLAHLRLLTMELALRCYQSDQGCAPSSLQQLVPKYLQRVPSDPFSDRSLIYRPSGTNWLVYSIGEDRVDDGGRPVGRGLASKGDIFFNSPW
jgi:hypothetical protein